MTRNPSEHPAVSRRGLLVAGTGTAAGLAVLAACGGSGGSASTGGYGVGQSSGASPDSPTPDSPTAASGTPGGSGSGLVELAAVPVGGAVSATGEGGEPLIVAQPTEGEVVAFSAICTHRGCTVAPQDKALVCPCHGSTYDPTTGENTGGPAPRPLPEVRVSVVDGVVTED